MKEHKLRLNTRGEENIGKGTIRHCIADRIFHALGGEQFTGKLGEFYGNTSGSDLMKDT